ncbi:unnamed protein product, partial [Mesorhabditis spiculigera]
MSNALIEVLQRTVSNNPADQKQALDFLQDAAGRDFPNFVKELSIVLQAASAEQVVRQAAGLQLKNVLVAKDDATKELYLKRWLQLPAENRDVVKKNVVLTLGTERSRPSTAAQCVAAIACAELPHGLWNEVIQFLMQSVTDPNSTSEKKESSLETLGYVCQDIKSDVLERQSNEILTAIVAGLHSSEKSNHVRLAATNALLNSLEFTRRNFEHDVERNHIMQVVCETSQSPELLVKVVALQCLVRIMSLYYQKMESYMRTALFPITLAAMKSAHNEEALQGIEFWSNVCEEEIELQAEAEEAAENNRVPEQTSKHYAKGACAYLCPVLLDKLAQHNEDDDEDEWTPPKAAGVCLMLLAQCVGDTIIECVLPFLQNFVSPDWKYREAAIMAFGSILDGPDPAKLNSLVSQALNPLIQALGDSNVKVRDTAAWTVGRVCEMAGEVVTQPDVLQLLLPSMYAALKQEPRVAANICWALVALAKSSYEDAANKHGTDGSGQPETYVLSTCFQGIVNELIVTSERPDSNQANLRLAAYETLMEMIKNSPRDCYGIVQQTTIVMLQKLEQLLMMEQQATNQADRAQAIDLQALLCATLQSVLRKIRSEDAEQLGEPILRGLMQIMQRSQGRAGNVMEEALMALGTLVEALGQKFAGCLEPIKPFLLHGLSSFEEHTVCTAAVGVVTDLCRSLEGLIRPILPDIMQVLIQCIRDPRPSRDVKIAVLSVFGDVALAIGVDFQIYIAPVVELLQQACNSAVINNPDDIDLVDYVHQLRENCIVAYTGILQGLKPADGASPAEFENAKQVIGQLVPHMAQLIHMTADSQPVSSPESVVAAAAGLVGDMANLYGGAIVQVLDMNKVNALLTRGRRARASKTKALCNWANKELRKCNVAAAS